MAWVGDPDVDGDRAKSAGIVLGLSIRRPADQRGIESSAAECSGPPPRSPIYQVPVAYQFTGPYDSGAYGFPMLGAPNIFKLGPLFS